MGWSTRELAELAGTSLRTVRHYHEVGLLPEPVRRANGYKSYDGSHLVRLLRIKRLTALGLSLTQVGELADSGERPDDLLRAIDEELAGTIERLQRVRAEIAPILRREAAADLPPGIPGAGMSESDRSVTMVMSRLVGPAGTAALTDLVQGYSGDATGIAFEQLAPDADEETRAELTDRMIRYYRGVLAEWAGARTWLDDAPRGGQFAVRALGEAMAGIYNPAQLDVLARVGRALPPPDALEGS